MSCHVIVHSRLSLSRGLQGVAAGANPSLEPATFRSLVDLLYPLSYSRPHREKSYIKSTSVFSA